jgi:CMP-N,N'-diacetyllegionaminic acid synthase
MGYCSLGYGGVQKLGKEFDTVTLLQPTSPLRDAEDIRNAFEIFEKKDADSVVSVCETEHSPLQCNTLDESGSLNGFLDMKAVGRRQDLATYYRINGAVYIQKTGLLMEKGNLYGEKSYASIMARDHSVDIDEELDFLIAEAIKKGR